MTYCVALNLAEGLVLASDTRTNAGVDHIATFTKMRVLEKPGQAVVVLMSAGNLATTQSVLSLLQGRRGEDGLPAIVSVPSLYEAAVMVGAVLREVVARDASATGMNAGIDFGSSFLVAGQIAGEAPRLFNVYPQGNFIEATAETPYFQIGESKYGKPVLDRVLTPDTPLDEAAKCALVSMDSTMKSNLSVGAPLDLVVYEADRLQSDKMVCIGAENPYYRMLHASWGQKLREAFDELDNPVWDGKASTATPLRVQDERSQPLRKITRPEDKLI